MPRPRIHVLTDRVREGLSGFTPERTRKRTWIEEMTTRRLSWEAIVRLNRYLEVAGRVATGLYVLFAATVVVGVDWRRLVEQLVNSGRPVKGAIALAVILPTLLFVALHSLIGYSRWRLQREMWRREVALLDASDGDDP